jgi:hypothetical protein
VYFSNDLKMLSKTKKIKNIFILNKGFQYSTLANDFNKNQ